MVLSERIRSKLNGTNADSDFSWLEEKVNKRSRFMQVKYYKGFKLNSQSYYEGACVQINIDAQFGVTEEKYEIGRILECYSSGDKNYKGFVKVQWFTHFDRMRKSHIKHMTEDYPPVDFDVEIAKDMWTYGNEVDVETISGHCCVKEVCASFSASTVKRPSEALGPMYICRFLYKKNSPYIFPLTENDVFKIRNVKSPFALAEITNSPNCKTVSSQQSRKNRMNANSLKKSDKKYYEESQEQNENLRRVKRKLLDLDEDQENVCTIKKRKTENKQPSNKSELNLRTGWSSIKNGHTLSSPQKLSIQSPCKNKISPLTPLKVGLSPLKMQVSSPLKSLEKESPKTSSKSPAIDRKINNIKHIGQYRGLRQGEISELLSDDEESSEMEDDEDSDFEVEEKKFRKIGFRKSNRKKNKHISYLEKIEEGSSCEKRVSRKVAHLKQNGKDEEEEVVENVLPQKRSRRSVALQTPKKERDEVVSVKSSSRRGGRERKTSETDDEEHMPTKISKDLAVTESATKKGKKCTRASAKKEKDVSKHKTPKGKGKHLALSNLPDRNTPIKAHNTEFEHAKAQLHVSAVPSYLPCRDDEFQQIYSFIEGKLLDSTGGCMYVSGVPGTGKTATIREVLKVLKECENDGNVPQFQFLDVNAMKLTKPNQLWVQIWEGLTGQRVTPDHAYSLFEKSLQSSSGPKRKSIFLLLDELDLLGTKKQDVMYNLFDLASRCDSRLIVITIANTMDLPERMMISRVQSRLGLTRMTFQPYTFKQLEEIIASRLQGIKAFDADAIQLVARKVAAVSGDARRALDICRRATELAELKKMEIISSPIKSPKKLNVLVGMSHVTLAISEMFSSPKVMAIRQCSQMVKYLLQAILTEFGRTGIEEALLMRVLEHLQSICRLDGLSPPSSSDALKIINVLSAQKIIFTEHSRLDLTLRIRLNISTDDVSYALSL